MKFLLKRKYTRFKKEFEKIKLEHEYLSSPEKLLEYHNLYFDDQLFKRKIEEIKIISSGSEKIKYE